VKEAWIKLAWSCLTRAIVRAKRYAEDQGDISLLSILLPSLWPLSPETVRFGSISLGRVLTRATVHVKRYAADLGVTSHLFK
jgi:hypothetical protein